MKPVRWGVLGAAKFARDHMAPAIHAAEGAELAALATSDPAKAEGFRAFCPGLAVHDSYQALLADPTIDAVYVPLPNHLHVEWTLKALAAGKHVLTEKPIALRADQIDSLIAARDASGLLAAEAFMIVHHPQWHRAKAWLEAGEIGQLRHVDAAFSYNNAAEPGNIRNRPDTGGGSLRDIGVYTIGSMRFVTGAEPEDVAARVIMEAGVEVFADLTAVMQGASGRFTYRSMTSMRLANRQEVVFQGDKGMIRVGSAPFNANVHDVAAVELHLPGQRVITDRFPTANHYKLQVEAFGRTIRTGAAYPCPLEFVRGTQAMMDAALDGAKEISL
ncbi:MAG: Gfo/Idh/MocA family oxidoreductase [Cypionkella sp.]|nr:Gfo/Idh/MocA family oxidoreductase [Cypionkella sp.]